MTHPLTPREKVVFKQPCEHCQRMTTVDLTALASGSGDHAELIERVREVADDCLDAKDGGIILGGTVAREHGADLEALLAEIAALRGEHVHPVEQKEGAEDALFNALSRATEAERRLAEAEAENTRWFLRMADVREASGIGVKPMLDEVTEALRSQRERLAEAVGLLRVVDGGAATQDWWRVAVRTFLSKEAERG